MRNPLFKKYTDDLFEKVAWPYDPSAVAGQVDPGLAGQITRGQRLGQGAMETIESIPSVLRGGKSIVEHVLAPASEAVAKPFFSGLKGVAQYAKAHPGLARGALGLAFLAPILGASYTGSRHKYEDNLMNLREDPGRDITASLDEFLEKKAAGGKIPSSYMNFGQAGKVMQHSLIGGIGGAVATGALGVLGNALTSGVAGLRDMFLTDRKRKQLFTQLLSTDVVLTDALERNPTAQEMLVEAYGTMCRFAPSLSLDINAVRSFLREAIIGGAGVNYATIKNLIETEKALREKGK